ncbi:MULTISPECIES: hypothetical protein [unclassified Microbacterium]|uniref:hypothetical protein n=1 Tax=unclassified Microbacterium TaxID=2609290 RepID=UPI00214AB33B|nr:MULTISPECIES: hypothetical protein [unclassified Microbacterium]MCR2808587.1 hypothetical protein [Microbacterium sp. zg.B185]WIM18975.1 hypothetical protein QNO12_15550 [Microbacterium sp. zg-B185]
MTAQTSGTGPTPQNVPTPAAGPSPDAAAMPAKRPAFEPPEQLLKPTGYDPGMRRPTTTIAGALLVLFRVITGVLVLVALVAGWDEVADQLDIWDGGGALTPEIKQLTLSILVALGAVVLAIDALLAYLIYRGRNWPRVVVMLISALSISTAFTAWWAQGQEITIEGTFVSLSLDILILLALSSRSASAYARRNERR